MNTIDQYYILAMTEIESTIDELNNIFILMNSSKDKHPFDRHIPSLSDINSRIATAQRLIIRHDMLCELGIENVSGNAIDGDVNTTKLNK